YSRLAFSPRMGPKRGPAVDGGWTPKLFGGLWIMLRRRRLLRCPQTSPSLRDHTVTSAVRRTTKAETEGPADGSGPARHAASADPREANPVAREEEGGRTKGQGQLRPRLAGRHVAELVQVRRHDHAGLLRAAHGDAPQGAEAAHHPQPGGRRPRR